MSIDLFVVRHGIAHEADPAEWPDDDERPLTRDGIEQFRKAAKGLANLAGKIDALYSSPLVRAVETAKILTDHVDWPEAQTLKELRSEAPVAALCKALDERTVDGTAIAVVGHEPQLSALLTELCGGRLEMKKGAVARLEVASFSNNVATLRWLLPPKVLRSARH